MPDVDPITAAALRAPFPPEMVGRLPKGGVMLDFVGHAAATDRLLQVDPEWTWEPFARDEAGLPALDKAGNLWINLTVAGVTRPGVGDGPDMKQKISDAIRNAAMRFGVALDLWSREDLSAAQIVTDPEWLAEVKGEIDAAPDVWVLDDVAARIKQRVADGRVAHTDRADLTELWLAKSAALAVKA